MAVTALLLAAAVCSNGQQDPQKPAPSPRDAVPTPSSAPSATTQVPGAAPAPPSAPAAVSQASQAAAIVLADVAPDYILGPEDSLTVNVWKDPTLSGGIFIRPDGKITLPLLGDVTAAGLTPMALAASIAEDLKKFLKNDPTVTVTVNAVNSKRVFFVGEIAHPGPLPMTRQFSMLQAIAAAGGLGPYAKRDKIYILRTIGGKETKLFFKYSKALKYGDEQGIKLLNGDTVVVP